MEISVRRATIDDVPELARMYEALEAELTALRPAWALADGLPHPAEEALTRRVADPAWHTYVAELDGVTVGLLSGRDEELLPQAGGAKVGSVRLIFTDAGAREVGVGEALMDVFLSEARNRGVTMFDAHVSPGHRLSKNFFEAHGFSARSIIMHRRDP